MEEHCAAYGLPARTDNVIVTMAISQVSQVRDDRVASAGSYANHLHLAPDR